MMGAATGCFSELLKLINKGEKAAKVAKTAYGNMADLSLSNVGTLLQAEPLTIVSKDCLSLEYLPDINQALLAMFSGYLVRGIDMLTVVSDVRVASVLGRVNPNRDYSEFIYGGESANAMSTLSTECYKHSLPGTTYNVPKDLALETRSSPAEVINEMSSLAVGKMLNVDITLPPAPGHDKPTKTTVNLSVRLAVSMLPPETIRHILAHKKTDQSFTERWHQMRAGRISFVKDLIFCQDLINITKKAMILDESGTLSEIVRRANMAKKVGLMNTGQFSLAASSNMFVITKEMAKQLEVDLSGSLNHPSTRAKLFENTYAMIIAVVDREREIVTFYINGIAAASMFTVKELKASSKGKGPDVFDILKALSGGNAPSF